MTTEPQIEGTEGTTALAVAEPVVLPEPPEPTPEPEKKSLDPRQQRLAKIIADRRETVRQEAGVQAPELEPEPAPEAGATTDSAGPTPKEEEAATDSPTNGDEPPAEKRTRKIVVNGVEREMTEEEIVAAAQRWIAGDDRLRQAAALRQGDASAKAPTPPSAGAQPESQPTQNRSAPPADLDKETLSKWSKAIAYGSEEEVATALAEFRNVASIPQDTSNNDVAGMVERAIRYSRFEDEHRSAMTTVGEQFPEVRADPHLFRTASDLATREVGRELMKLGYTVDQLESAPTQLWWQRFTEAHMAGYPVRQLADIYGEAAKQTWEKYGRPAPAPEQQQTATVSQLADRREQKAGMTSPPRPANATAVPPPPREETTEAKLARMRKMRGQ